MSEDYTLLVGSIASLQLQEAADWCEEKRRGLGSKFMLDFRQATSLLKKHPRLKREIYRNFRRALMRKFPYAIFYSIDEEKRKVTAVFHTGSDTERITKVLDLD